jgi:large subunit ribosomal protein L10
MPSAKILEEKKQLVIELAEKIRSAAGGVLVDYRGISVEQDTLMRAEMRKAEVDYFVIKNTLTRFAVKECGYEDLLPVLEKMTAIAVSKKDPTAPAKILKSYADKIESFNIKAGFVDGKTIDVAGVEMLATLPSKEVLISKVMGSLNAPISGLVNVLNGNLRGLACVLQAIHDQKANA